MYPSQLDPAPSFRCVSVAEATEIADRLYAGHRKKNDGSQEQGRSQTNNKQHHTARTSAAGSSETADSTSTNKSPVVSVTPAALCCIHPLCFLFYTPLLHADVVVYTSSTPHYCIHTVTILFFIILSFILISPHQLNIVHVPLRSEEHTSELQSHSDLVCRLLLEKKKKKQKNKTKNKKKK